jgi:putative transposase
LRHQGKRGRPHGDDLRMVVNAILYISKTGCQWRMLPAEFGPWTRIWTQFRRWSANGTWAWLLAEMHKVKRAKAGRAETPSMVIVDSHMARGASSGGVTFHDRGGKYGSTNGAKRVVAVDVTGLPVTAKVLPASVHDNTATEEVLAELDAWGGAGRLELVMVDRGVSSVAAGRIGRATGVEVRRVGWDDKQPMFRPVKHAWRVEVAHGRIGRARRLAKSFENTTTSATGWLEVACLMLVLRGT